MTAPTIETTMKNFHAKLGSDKLKWIMSQFSGNKTLQDMFAFFWDLEESHEYLKLNLLPSGKSQTEAERLQAEGDKYFVDKCLNEALEEYNLSIMHAHHPAISLTDHDGDKKNFKTDTKPFRNGDYVPLATGFAKRSAVLYELEHFEECLKDIRLALAYGYEDSLGDLEDRKAKCLTAHNNNLIKDYEVLERLKSSLKTTSGANTVQNVPEIIDPHPTLPSLCRGINVAYSTEKGKHIIAERDIDPGEVLGVEKSCCNCLDLANLPSHCSTCLMKCQAPLPCPDCSMVVFCSEACRIEGLSGHHWLECRLLPTMVAIGIQPVFSISFKLLKRYSCEQWRSNIEQPEDDTIECSSEIKGLSNLSDFKLVSHLVTNKELRLSGDLYVKCLISFLLTKLLQQSGKFFVNSSEEPITPTREDLLFTGQLLFLNILKISCNGFKLAEFQCSGNFSEMQKKNIGSGVFPFLCLFNHSCHPNSEPYSYGSIQVLRACRPIPAGSEVTESYCRGFYLQPTAARQRSLMSVFQFHCTCEACEANWPTYQELPSTLQFKCLECHQPVSDSVPMCMKCFLDYERKDYDHNKQLAVDEWWRVTKQVRYAFEKSQQVASKIMAGEAATQVDMDAICNAITLMEKHVPFPCQPLWDAHDALDLYFHLEREKEFTNEQLSEV